MHPNAFLKTFWRMELRPEIFVAMSFSPVYEERFRRVIEPAIREITIGGVPLVPNRVDLSKTGDSILTDIMDGIAHAQLVLADVSTVGTDKATGRPFRNGNVMFEVGVALACRQPGEVFLVRDDGDDFLFDVSTIPHKRIDFTDHARAGADLHALLLERLRDRDYFRNARMQLALTALSGEELRVLEEFKKYGIDQNFGFTDVDSVNFTASVAIPRLLDKHVIRLAGKFSNGSPIYGWTELGFALAKLATEGLPVSPLPPIETAAPRQSTEDAALVSTKEDAAPRISPDGS